MRLGCIFWIYDLLMHAKGRHHIFRMVSLENSDKSCYVVSCNYWWSYVSACRYITFAAHHFYDMICAFVLCPWETLASLPLYQCQSLTMIVPDGYTYIHTHVYIYISLYRDGIIRQRPPVTPQSTGGPSIHRWPPQKSVALSNIGAQLR